MSDDKAKTAQKAEARAKPKAPKKPRASRKPTQEEIRAAMVVAAESANRSEHSPGSVIGLGPDWVPMIIPLDLPAGKVEQCRMAAKARGYSHEPGLHVAGIDACEVWIIPREVWAQTIFAEQKRQSDADRARLQIREPIARF